MILGSLPVTLSRNTGSRGTDGRWVDGTPTTSTIYGSIQPMNGKDMASLPEGERQVDGKKFYTRTLLKTANQHDGTPADRIIYDSITYEVRGVAHENRIIPHYKALLVRIQE